MLRDIGGNYMDDTYSLHFIYIYICVYGRIYVYIYVHIYIYTHVFLSTSVAPQCELRDGSWFDSGLPVATTELTKHPFCNQQLVLPTMGRTPTQRSSICRTPPPPQALWMVRSRVGPRPQGCGASYDAAPYKELSSTRWDTLGHRSSTTSTDKVTSTDVEGCFKWQLTNSAQTSPCIFDKNTFVKH